MDMHERVKLSTSLRKQAIQQLEFAQEDLKEGGTIHAKGEKARTIRELAIVFLQHALQFYDEGESLKGIGPLAMAPIADFYAFALLSCLQSGQSQRDDVSIRENKLLVSDLEEMIEKLKSQ